VADQTDPPNPQDAPAPDGANEDAPTPVGEAPPDDQFTLPDALPILPLRGTAVFPSTVMPLSVGRSASLRMLEDTLPNSKVIALVAQKDESVETPGPDDMYDVGTAGIVLRLIRQENETVSLIVHGLQRIRVQRFLQTDPFLRASVEPIEEKEGAGKTFEATVNQLEDESLELIELSPNAPEEAVTVLRNIDETSHLVDFIAANLQLDLPQQQELLAEPDVATRVRTVYAEVNKQLQLARLQQKIQEDVQSEFGDIQRKHFLRQQLKAIQRELGEGEEGQAQIVEELRQRLIEAEPPEKVMEEAERELERLEAIPPASPEYSVITTYIELIADLPWNKLSEDNLDLDRAKKILDRDHYGLDKVKRRLVEYLAVRKLNPRGRGPILCLVGPPGVGKTSLGQSVADALGREFSRMSLGGIRDEAEIRGHRRTYIGAMPGRIIQELRRAGTRNPVMMLDEIDKLGSDFRGDPASALLEVLDPRQNDSFVDRYLDVPFDLSSVLFIATANYMGPVPPALRDRMEVIELPGYTDNDKLQIAKKYLVPRQLEEHGLNKSQCKWNTAAIRKVIEEHTREAGVRELERQVGAVCRGVAAQVASGEYKTRTVNEDLVRELLGPRRHFRELDTRTKVPGVVVGLAYTPTGGEILFIEAAVYPGKGHVTVTGQLGEVMKESTTAAMSLFKSKAPEFGYDVKKLAELDVHIHVPAGAVPKDGPSAGLAMYTALVSLLLDVPVKQRVAMTGEITLRGLALPIGGVKEKSLAASRAGIKTIILPKRNEPDLEEVDAEVKKKCKFVFVENVDEVLEESIGQKALEKAKKRVSSDGKS